MRAASIVTSGGNGTGGSKSQAMQRAVVVSGGYLPGTVASSTCSRTALTAGRRPGSWDRQRAPARWYGTAHLGSLMYLDGYVTTLVNSDHGSCSTSAGGREPTHHAGDL